LDGLIRDKYVEEIKGRKGKKAVFRATETLRVRQGLISKIDHLSRLIYKLASENREIGELLELRDNAELAFQMLELEILKSELPRNSKKDLIFDLVEAREGARKLISSALVNLKTDEIRKVEMCLLEAAKKLGHKIPTYEEIVRRLEKGICKSWKF